ncbi:asparagine synthase (glutamine-hydrolyzing) [Flavobacterium sp. KS-LB2]|uniref:asparagine synthase (glutamine-hydrolyzing) n=1 Tax=Flavobacterium sp. KS-LB2 TaxID=3120525 RepID=UPI0030CC4D66
MCGISGFFDTSFQLGQDQLEKYNAALAHRGPDGKGVFFEKTDRGSIGLGHTRLSILDISALGQQPMQYEHLTIVLNGEIYNFKTIQEELKALGYAFTSSSDTEVVLKSFHAFGTACVEKFRGMFAFAIYNSLEDKLYLCRDRVGVKPLYWYLDSQKLIFGSELKVFFNTTTFTAKVDVSSLCTFINYGYSTNDNTILHKVKKACTGSWTIYDCKTNEVEVLPYWNYGALLEKEKYKGTFKEAVQETEKLAQEASELRMISDVPIGVFLSGGFDSTMVTALLQKDRTEKLKTFTIGFSDGVDESHDAMKIATHLGTEHTSYDCRQQDAIDLIPLLPFLYDDPLADISCIPTILVSKLARKDVAVALSADGGDELFGGYGGFQSTPKIFSKVNQIPFKNLVGTIAKSSSTLFTGKYNYLQKKIEGIGNMLSAAQEDRISQLHLQQNGFPREMMDSLFAFPFKQQLHQKHKYNLIDPLDDLYILGIEDTLTNLLLPKVDRGAMGVSLEGREPLLDHRLMEFAASLPYNYKHNGVESKRPIREIVYKYVPKALMDRPKVGFDLPIYKWLKSDLSFLLDQHLNTTSIARGGFFNPAYVDKLVSQFKKGELRYVSIIWRLLIFQMWFESWIEKNNSN